MDKKKTRLMVGIGLAGLVIQLVGILWATTLFGDLYGKHYTFLNNFISELGAPGSSKMAKVFNATMILSAPLTFPILYTLGRRLKSKLGNLSIAIGFCATLGVIGVGIYPMDMLKPHFVAAMAFFWGWMLTVVLLTVAFLRKNSFKTSPSLVIGGVAAFITCLLFLGVLFGAAYELWNMVSRMPVVQHGVGNGFPMNTPSANMQGFHRPAIWNIAVLEWCVFAAGILWNLSAARFLFVATESES